MFQSIKKYFIFMFLVVGCGKEVVVVEKEVPTEDPGGQPGGQPGDQAKSISYTQMQSLLNANCAKCHAAADFMQSETVLRKKSRVLEELNTRNMPPNKGALSDGDRNLMVNFFR
tara:strand:- start:2300 stop:2641 length:342 start_codon:yes stop_codon:yes gene_type:complete